MRSKGEEMTTEVATINFEEITGQPLENYRHQCHTAALLMVKAGFGERVLRGWHRKIGGQHSWVLIDHDDDVYDIKARIADPTLWSYTDTSPQVWEGPATDHRPHGAGSIWQSGRAVPQTTDYVRLTPTVPLSDLAHAFIHLLGPLDRAGWSVLADGSMEGWPAGEILAAMDDTPQLKALVPIDRLGMLTDRNPGELYR